MPDPAGRKALTRVNSRQPCFQAFSLSHFMKTAMTNYSIGPDWTQVATETKPNPNPNPNPTYPTNPTKR